ncbi:MAG: hypothetical protein KDD36_03145 [Flavobacteriales bacterium]|nr:hypothetical protein [Flavobacteriales bacterium]
MRKVALLLVLITGLGTSAFPAESYLEFTAVMVVDDQPLAGVSANLMRSGKSVEKATSGSDGSFNFHIPYDGVYSIELTKAGYVGMTIELNTTVPASMKKYILIYKTTLDVFPEKDGYIARLRRPAVVKVNYIRSKENFGMPVPYENSVSYVLKPKEENPPLIKTESKEEITKETKPIHIESETPPISDEEAQIKKETEELNKASDLKFQRAAAAGNQEDPKERVIREEVKENVVDQRKVAEDKESVDKINQTNVKKELESRQAKARVTRRWREELSEAVNKEKQKNP